MKCVVAALMAVGLPTAWAQEPPTVSAVDHSKMDHGGSASANNDSAGMVMDHGAMQGGTAPPDARDPDAYSNGLTLGAHHQRMHSDQQSYAALRLDRLEAVRTSGTTSAAYELQFRYGRDYDRLVVKAEGEANAGRTEEARTELLWGHAVAIYWDTQLGVRLDSGRGPERHWLAFGIQGLAPYWFEIDAAVYVGDAGRSALRLSAEYELLLTQKLVLQPRVEANLYGQRDIEREQGAGLSELTAGLRLRYEIRREFAPYVGIEWTGKYGATAKYARSAGDDASETRVVAGLRFWY